MASISKSIYKRNWKIDIDLDAKPQVVLVRLYDLIFDENGNYRYPVGSSATVDQINGFSVGHDIICYDQDLYRANTGELDKDRSELWETHGIDICLAEHDNRALTRYFKVESVDNTAFYFKTKKPNTSSTGGYFTKKEPSAALMPMSASDMMGQAPWSMSSSGLNDLRSYNPIWVGTTSTSSWNEATLILSDTDTIFNGSITTQGNVKSFTRACLNPKSDTFWDMVSILLNVEFKQETNEAKMTALLNAKANIVPSEPSETTSGAAFVGNPYKEAMKGTYVWLRAPFYADYIKNESFGQDLTPESDVKHRNILLSGNGDFNRYDSDRNDQFTDFSDSDDTRSENTKPYISKTAPLVDLISDTILEMGENETLEQYMTRMIAKAYEDDTTIGALLTESIDRMSALEETSFNVSYNHLTPPSYFDPMSRKKASEYSHRPTVIPRDGNIFTSGRVISPTIDEIWIYLKKLVSGRGSDADKNVTQRGTPIADSTRTTSKENYLNDVSDIQFSIDNVVKKGDPLNFKIVRKTGERATSVDKTGTVDSLVIDNFISRPSGVVYSVYTALLDLSSTIVGGRGSSEDLITGLLPFEKDSETDGGDMISAGSPYYGVSNWTLRDSPLSLRELEAFSLENKYNIVSFGRFVRRNVVFVGPLGASSSPNDSDKNSGDYNFVGGSLFQLHKDYNHKIEEPNTVFDKSGENGLAAKSRDENVVYSADGYKRLKDDDGNIIYGNDPTLPNSSQDYTSSDVYLSAEGEWRSRHEHLRMPILWEEY